MIIECKECGERMELRLEITWKIIIENGKIKNYIQNPIRWLRGICYWCDATQKLRTDFLQPFHREYARVYGIDPFNETKIKEKKAKKEEGQKQAELEEKYDSDKTLKAEDRRFIKKEVLGDGGIVNETLEEIRNG